MSLHGHARLHIHSHASKSLSWHPPRTAGHGGGARRSTSPSHVHGNHDHDHDHAGYYDHGRSPAVCVGGGPKRRMLLKMTIMHVPTSAATAAQRSRCPATTTARMPALVATEWMMFSTTRLHVRWARRMAWGIFRMSLDMSVMWPVSMAVPEPSYPSIFWHLLRQQPGHRLFCWVYPNMTCI